MSRILGLVLVLVLVGVFSFVAYRKYREATLHPGAEQIEAATNGTAPPAPEADPKAVASNAAPGTSDGSPPSSPFDEPGKAEVKPSSGGLDPNAATPSAAAAAAAQANAAQPTATQPNSGQQLAGGGAADQPFDPKAAASPADNSKPAPAAAGGNEANPFGDLAANGPEKKVGQPDPSRAPSTAAKGAGAGAGAGAANESDEFFAADGRRNDAAKTANAPPATNGAPAGTTNAPVVQATAAAGQSEPAGNEFPTERSKTGEVVKHDRAAPPKDSTTVSAKGPGAESAGGLLDQQEPDASSAKGTGDPTVRTTQAAGTTTVQPADSRTASTGDDMFAEKRSDSSQGTGTAVAGRKAPTDALDDPVTGKSTRVNIAAAPAPAPAAGNTSATGNPTAKSAPAGSPAADANAFADASPVDGMSGRGTVNDAGDAYVVQPADSFWTISRKRYGTGRYFRALAELNKSRVPDPERMRPGIRVSTPPAEILETRFAQFLPKGSAVQPVGAERGRAGAGAGAGAGGGSRSGGGPSQFFVSADGRPLYRTGEKDTLSDIAAKHLGRASRWIQIFEMNRDKLTSPNELKVGLELVLPADASNVGSADDKDDRR